MGDYRCCETHLARSSDAAGAPGSGGRHRRGCPGRGGAGYGGQSLAFAGGGSGPEAVPLDLQPLPGRRLRRHRRTRRRQLGARGAGHGYRRGRGTGSADLRVPVGDDQAGHVGPRRDRAGGRGPAPADPQPDASGGWAPPSPCSALAWGGPPASLGRPPRLGAADRRRRRCAASRGRSWTTRQTAGPRCRALAGHLGCPAGRRAWRWLPSGVVALATQGQGFDVVVASALAAVAVARRCCSHRRPWVLRIWQDLQSEQAARIRATERADIAAHLHDSVLQTLALIQRQADDPRPSRGSPARRSASCATGSTTRTRGADTPRRRPHRGHA